MGQPIATKGPGICFAFPDVCMTPAPPGPNVPVPYPNIGMLSDASPVAESVRAGGNPVIVQDSQIGSTVGDQAGTGGPGPGGPVTFVTYSGSVRAEGKFVVRMFDTTKQNGQNAVGQVLGGLPTVLVGG